MAPRVNIMQAEVNKTEVVKDTRARSNICWGCGEILGTSIRIVEIPIKGNIGTK